MAGIPLSELPAASSIGDNDLLLITQSDTSKKAVFSILKEYVESIIENNPFSNPNLLINPWFTVNQREISTATANEAFISDRWRIYHASASVENDGSITVTKTQDGAGLYQILPYDANIIGKTVTLSILYGNGTIDSGTFTVPATGVTTTIMFEHLYLSFGTKDNNLQFTVMFTDSTPVNIRALKLEISPTSSLHLDTFPDFSTELLKCQRYFIRIGTSSTSMYMLAGEAKDSTTWDFMTVLPTIMRVTPQISYAGLRILKGSTDYAVSSIEEISFPAISQYINIRAKGSGFPTGAFGKLQGYPTGYIDLNSEL